MKIRIAMRLLKTTVLLVAFLAMPLCGCQGKYKTYRVEGKVTLSDGTPLPNVELAFTCDDLSLSALAVTDKNGEYRVGTLREDDGAPAGDYRVTAVQSPSGSIDQPVSVRIDDKYANPETSGLEFTVEPKRNRFDIKLDPLVDQRKRR